MASEIQIRAAREGDIPAVTEITSHYVLNTVLSFVEQPPSHGEVLSRFQSIAAEGLPFIVAVLAPSDGEELLLGYASVKGFRGMKGAYRHTVELSLFCHRDHQGKGIGSLLLRHLLAALRDPKEFCSLYPPSVERSPDGSPREVRQVLAVMAVDDQGKRGGMALKEFYEGFGFILVSLPGGFQSGEDVEDGRSAPGMNTWLASSVRTEGPSQRGRI